MGKTKEISGGSKWTTNNQMELTGAIEASKTLTEPCEIRFYTDSTNLQKGITDWISNWKRNGWRTATKRRVKDSALWQELDRLAERHQITWRWAAGHAGNWGN